ncbi:MULTISPECIES: DUF5316 family protein [Carnobacterium]|uniref:Uncharacterized protein n=2 Tax=Carnobacterium inhibens TaxID=147709 RepID=U5SF79_9LACT|nr:DUF5316 family protein [Carnobacterium inhibens]AGY82753.1 hypothetical protein Q783_00400 [Carnobacterium inhibens subsp. gilichinskyi]MBC9825619.1 hypothetical protein [Carnobacterium inhibens]MCM3513171.1 DUF5316 domain-containing protein [Carnobacterium inhibens]
MKRSLLATVKIFYISVVLIFLIYLLAIFTSLSFNKTIHYSSVGLTVLAIILSGAFVSGDRQRCNYYSNPVNTTKSIFYSWKILIFALPFYLVLLVDYLS